MKRNRCSESSKITLLDNAFVIRMSEWRNKEASGGRKAVKINTTVLGCCFRTPGHARQQGNEKRTSERCVVRRSLGFKNLEMIPCRCCTGCNYFSPEHTFPNNWQNDCSISMKPCIWKQFYSALYWFAAALKVSNNIRNGSFNSQIKIIPPIL